MTKLRELKFKHAEGGGSGGTTGGAGNNSFTTSATIADEEGAIPISII